MTQYWLLHINCKQSSLFNSSFVKILQNYTFYCAWWSFIVAWKNYKWKAIICIPFEQILRTQVCVWIWSGGLMWEGSYFVDTWESKTLPTRRLNCLYINLSNLLLYKAIIFCAYRQCQFKHIRDPNVNFLYTKLRDNK